MTKEKRSLFVRFLIGFVILVGLDQWTKGLASAYLKGNSPLVLIRGVFELYYSENRGAAFGILKDSRWIFMVGSILIFCVLIWLYYKTPLTKKYQPVRILSTFLGAGAVGNMIDRVFRGYVIDFFYFSWIDFPVFNVADIYVVMSILVLVYLFLAVYKEEDFDFLQKRKKKA